MAKQNIGKKVDEIYKWQKKRDKLEAQVAALDKIIDSLKDDLLENVKRVDLAGVQTAIARCSVEERDVPTVKDFDVLCKFIAKTKSWDLLQKRVSSDAWRARMQDGVKVPGVEIFKRITLRVAAKKR